jgi:hypothetical protein
MNDFENFEDKTKEEKIETLKKLSEKLSGEELNGFLQQFGFEGEMTVRVLDEDGNEKAFEKTDINEVN